MTSYEDYWKNKKINKQIQRKKKIEGSTGLKQVFWDMDAKRHCGKN